MEQKYMFGFFAVAIVAILGIGIVSAFGAGKAGGFMSSSLTADEKAQFQEQRQAMQTAVENQDYSAWKALHEQRIASMQTQLTEENFNRIVERHAEMKEVREHMQEARETGDFSKVQELKEKYGLGKSNGKGRSLQEDCPSIK